MTTAVKSAAAVTEDLVAKVAENPEWTARVLCAAASA